MSKAVRRLYAELKPVHYDLRIVPDAVSLKFTGSVAIQFKKTGRPSQRLTFHQNGLKISRATIVKQDKKGSREIAVTRINNQNTLHEVRLHTEEMIYSGDYAVTMEFGGTITRNMSGLYPCFFDVQGKEHVLLATQFESHHAREVFPCIDEPEAKATFKLTLVSPAGLQVLSNTPVEKQAPIDKGLTETTFITTPCMSTYLLAFVIGELHSKTTKSDRGIEVTAWATIAQPSEALDFGLDVAKRSIDFFEQYFGVEYPLPKADHVALPDFGSGSAAMENWGLITYREDYFLAYPGESSQSSKEHMAISIAHETAHQWFGDLTTMRWWDDLWLNESFASIMEYEAIDSIFPDWHVWDEFVARDALLALRRDATPGVQPVKSTVHHPDEIGTLFDPYIVYAKGSRLLYMLKQHVGEAAFRKGLTQYFKEYAYKNTVGDDLWQALSAARGTDVGAFMKPWLERSGFPVVTVAQKGNRVTLSQQHFLEGGQPSDGRIWPVPLFSETSDLPAELTVAERDYRLASSDWVYLNHASAGHYIVHYAEPAHRAHLAELVSRQQLGAADRLIVLNSASMLAKAGYQSFADVLELLAAYDSEDAETVWGTIALIVGEARRFIDWDESLEPRIKTFIRRLIQREHQRLGWEELPRELPADRKLRSLILGLGVYADEPAIVAEGLKRFEVYRRNATEADPELRALVFGLAVRQKAKGAFEFLLELHDTTTNSDLRGDVAAALATTHDQQEAAVLLDRLKDPRRVRPQDLQHWLAYLMRNRHTREAAWTWMVDNWDWLKQAYSSDKSYDSFPRYAAGCCNTQEWAQRYKDFFAPKQEEVALKRNIQIGLAEIETRVKWLERDLAGVRTFFDRS